MPKTYTLAQSNSAEVREAREATRDKQADKRLRAVQLRMEGKKNKEIAQMLETTTDMVSRWVCSYVKDGIESLLPKKRTGHHRNMSFEEEAEFLSVFKEQASRGEMIEVNAIKAAYEARVGHTIGGSQIYYVLRRHGWRKLMPRTKHPKKASEAEIASTKKLRER
jgi:transposase